MSSLDVNNINTTVLVNFSIIFTGLIMCKNTDNCPAINEYVYRITLLNRTVMMMLKMSD